MSLEAHQREETQVPLYATPKSALTLRPKNSAVPFSVALPRSTDTATLWLSIKQASWYKHPTSQPVSLLEKKPRLVSYDRAHYIEGALRVVSTCNNFTPRFHSRSCLHAACKSLARVAHGETWKMSADAADDAGVGGFRREN